MLAPQKRFDPPPQVLMPIAPDVGQPMTTSARWGLEPKWKKNLETGLKCLPAAKGTKWRFQSSEFVHQSNVSMGLWNPPCFLVGRPRSKVPKYPCWGTRGGRSLLDLPGLLHDPGHASTPEAMVGIVLGRPRSVPPDSKTKTRKTEHCRITA